MGGKLGPGCMCTLLSCASRDPPQLCTINPSLPGYHKVPATASDEPESSLPLVHRLPCEGRASARVMWGSGEKGLPASRHPLVSLPCAVTETLRIRLFDQSQEKEDSNSKFIFIFALFY